MARLTYGDRSKDHYWTNSGEVTSGVFDPIGTVRSNQDFLRRSGIEFQTIQGIPEYHHAAPWYEKWSVNRNPDYYPEGHVPTMFQLTEEGEKLFKERAEEWNKNESKLLHKELGADPLKYNRAVDAAKRAIYSDLVDKGLGVEMEMDNNGRLTGRYRQGKVIAASDGYTQSHGRQVSNIDGTGDADYTQAVAAYKAAEAYEQSRSAGSRGNDVGSRSTPNPTTGHMAPAPYVNPGYAAKFQEIMASRVQPGDLLRMAASAREHNAAHTGQNVPYFGDDNAAGREYLK